MPDHPADGPVVEVVWSGAAEENALQDPSRKLDGIFQRRVERVHYGGPAVSDLGVRFLLETNQTDNGTLLLTQSVLFTFSLSLEKA